MNLSHRGGQGFKSPPASPGGLHVSVEASFTFGLWVDLAVHRHALPRAQLGVDAGGAATGAGPGVDFPDYLHQLPVAQFPRRLGAAEPVVESRSRYVQHPAGHRDRYSIVGKLTDQREDYFGRTFSRAKYAAARRRISFSCSSSRLRSRSSANSFFWLILRDLGDRRCPGGRARRRAAGTQGGVAGAWRTSFLVTGSHLRLGVRATEGSSSIFSYLTGLSQIRDTPQAARR